MPTDKCRPMFAYFNVFGVVLSGSNRHTFLHAVNIAIIVSTTSMKSVMKQLMTMFSIVLLLGIFKTQDAEAGPASCATYIAAASGPCIAGCTATGPAYLACVMACEVGVTFTTCLIPCGGPFP